MVTQAYFLTLSARPILIVVSINQDKSNEYCNDENLIKLENSWVYPVWLMPRAREKGNGKDSK